MEALKNKKSIVAILVTMLLTFSFLSIETFAVSYDDTGAVYDGYQGSSNQQIILFPRGGIEIKTLDKTNYINKITTLIDPSNEIYFDFQMYAGMNTFKENDFKTNNMPQIKIMNADLSATVAEYNSGSGAVKYGGMTPGAENLNYPTEARYITISVDAGKLKNDTVYALVFGKSFCGNNTSKTLGKDVVFLFKTTAAPTTTKTESTTVNSTTTTANTTAAKTITDTTAPLAGAVSTTGVSSSNSKPKTGDDSIIISSIAVALTSIGMIALIERKRS